MKFLRNKVTVLMRQYLFTVAEGFLVCGFVYSHFTCLHMVKHLLEIVANSPVILFSLLIIETGTSYF